MEDTSDWLKNKIKPTESVIRSSGITSQEIPDTDVQESTEIVTPIIKKSESKKEVSSKKSESKKSPSKKSDQKEITIPNVAVIGEDFKVDFNKEYNYVEIKISNGIRWEVPNPVWNAGGDKEEVGSPLIEFFQESDTEKWSTVTIPIKSTQTVHGREINILKPEEILVEVCVRLRSGEEHKLHEKIQLVEN
jgi:hypothetical protein|tara:strand:- start:2282 stop:2854 length:573 start_codon:yes stop_codon:yes gene_type:complete